MKKALLVGINRYPDPDNELKGCVNDVRQMAETLKSRYGFPGDGHMRILTDARATTKAILDGLAWLTAGASPGDSLVFHYSGHGSQVPDKHGDETTDRLDEILCPYDLDWEHPSHRRRPRRRLRRRPPGGPPHRHPGLLPLRHRPARLRPRRQPPFPVRPHASRESGTLRPHPSPREFRPPPQHPPVRRPRPAPLPPSSGDAASCPAAFAPPRPPVRRQRHPHQRRADRRLPGRPDLGRRLDRRRLPRGSHVPPLPHLEQRDPRSHLPRPRFRHRDRALPRRLRPGPPARRSRKIARAAVLRGIVSDGTIECRAWSDTFGTCLKMSEKGMPMKRIGGGSWGLPFNLRCGMMPIGIRLYDMTVPMGFHIRTFFSETGSREKSR